MQTLTAYIILNSIYLFNYVSRVFGNTGNHCACTYTWVSVICELLGQVKVGRREKRNRSSFQV